MGMFDWVDFEMPCPKCGTQLKRWQSKSGVCELRHLHPWETEDASAYCESEKCAKESKEGISQRYTVEFEHSRENITKVTAHWRDKSSDYNSKEMGILRPKLEFIAEEHEEQP